MKKAGGGSIINLGSVSWHLALPDLSIYETAKAGIEGMTRALARDLGESNIRVNCVVPGAIRTPRQMKLWHTPEEEAKILAQQCLKARVDPVHVTAMVLFLASDDARMCTAPQLLGRRRLAAMSHDRQSNASGRSARCSVRDRSGRAPSRRSGSSTSRRPRSIASTRRAATKRSWQAPDARRLHASRRATAA